MTIRQRLARWLDPETTAAANRHWYLRTKLSEAQDWLGNEFPEIDEAIFWAKAAELNHFRKLGEPSVQPVQKVCGLHGIYEFREYLRRVYKDPA